MPTGGTLFFKLIHPLALESTSKTPPAPPGEVVSAFFLFPFLFWGAFLTRCGLLFLFGSGLGAGFPALQDSSLSSIPGRTGRVAIFAKIPKGCAREPVVKFRHGPTPPL